MNMNSQQNVYSVEKIRELFIRDLNSSDDKTEFSKENADSLYKLDLTMYSSVYSFESAIFNGLSLSELDSNISLHPEQLRALELMKKNRGLIFSAPTSFGKTFTIFEYIARCNPKIVVLVVPTLALIDEYRRKIINKYNLTFQKYKVYLSIDEEKEYDLENYSLFLVTHDRVISENIKNKLHRIDFLVIDEVYKLQKNENDDRVLILNLAYSNLVSISQKYILLAPFIKGVENLEKLEHKPTFYSTNYSPVVNDLETIPLIDEKDRNNEAKKVLDKVEGSTLVYFPTVVQLNSFIESLDSPDVDYENYRLIKEFIDWAKDEIHEEWSIIKAMKKGYLVHHGQISQGIRMLELDIFNGAENNFNRLLCTSTLLEGVNTVSENIIITKPYRSKDITFDAFDFYNLVGRTGRLFKHYLGKAYYLKGPTDLEYIKADALKSIEFELTSDSIDIDINIGDFSKHDNFVKFLNDLGTDYETYKKEIASKCRFDNVKIIYDRFEDSKDSLIDILEEYKKNDALSKLQLIRILYKIVQGVDYSYKLKTYIINKLTYMPSKRITIKQIVNETKEQYHWKESINKLINQVIYLKTSYIEYEFYKKIHIVLFFMKCEDISQNLIDIIHERLLKNIEAVYYLNSPSRKMLKEMGIYDSDIEKIIKQIGDDFDTVGELKKRLIEKKNNIHNLSSLSQFLIERLID